MDDQAVFGPVLHRLSFRDAIERGLLTDYRVVVIGVDDPGVGRAVERRELLTVGDRVIDAKTLAKHVGLLDAVNRFRLTRILTFHSRRASARRFAQSLPRVIDWLPKDRRPPGRLWAQQITGEMNAGYRAALLDQLRALVDADWGVLSNVRCVAEGIDVPALDGIVFIDPRRGQIDVIQAVGRAIRRSPEKQLGTIVIPVFIPDGTDAEATLDSSDFGIVGAVVRALRAHDDVLAEQLDTARFALGRRGGDGGLPEKIFLDLPATVSSEFARAFSARIVESATSAFEFWFGLLTQYVDQHGTVAGLGRDVVLDGHKLGLWVENQHRRNVPGVPGELSADRVARLSALPGWTWDRQEAL
jgi:Helicase conserved C-terminal domain